MPRDMLRQLHTERAQAHRTTMQGVVLTPFKLTTFDNGATLMAVADVQVEGKILSSVPLAENNLALYYAAPNTPVILARSESGRVEVTGLSKRGIGKAWTYTVQIPSFTPVNSGTTSGITPLSVTPVSTINWTSRTATLGELQSATSAGFNFTPLQGTVIVDGNDDIVSVL